MDGSSEIKPAGTSHEEGGACGEELMCTARAGKWKNIKVCIFDKYRCDRVVHCEGEEDEVGCRLQAGPKMGISDHTKCKTPDMQKGRCLFPALSKVITNVSFLSSPFLTSALHKLK